MLHPDCRRVFRIKPDRQDEGQPLRLHRHQAEAIRVARDGDPYVLTTGTGSGKSLAYIVPIVDHVLRRGSGRRHPGDRRVPDERLGQQPVRRAREVPLPRLPGRPTGRSRFARYTGQENARTGSEILAKPPDILLTNYVMLELILTRPQEQALVQAAQGLRFLVLDELHTYRGRQGADVAHAGPPGPRVPRRADNSSASARRPPSPAQGTSPSSRPRSPRSPASCSAPWSARST